MLSVVVGAVVDRSERVAPASPNSCEALLGSVIGPGSSVVLVGGDESLAASLTAAGCTVERAGLDEPAPGGARTGQVVLVASGVLGSEAPEELLSRARQRMDPGGRLVVLFENAAHTDRRLAVLAGRRFDEPPSLDGTSGLDLDTRAHVLEVVARAGYQVTEVLATVVDPVRVPGAVPEMLAAWVRHQPESHEATFVVVAAPGGPALPPPLTGYAAEHPGVGERWVSMPELEGMEAASQEIIRLRRALLTLRDHQIGALAEAGTLRRERNRLREENKELVHDRMLIQQSLSWKVGRTMVAPVSKMKRVLRGGTQ